MDFSWMIVVLAAQAIVIFEGKLSLDEGTFWPHQAGGTPVNLPFVWHGGVVVGDLILLPHAFGLWWPHMEVPVWLWAVMLPLALWITWACHRAWWFQCAKQPGFMYPNRLESEGDPDRWYRDLPDSAWVHGAYMVAALMLIGGYLWSPMSSDIVWRTCGIFVIFVPVAIIEPGIVQARPPTRKDIAVSVGVALGLWAVVALVTWIKLTHQLGL